MLCPHTHIYKIRNPHRRIMVIILVTCENVRSHSLKKLRRTKQKKAKYNAKVKRQCKCLMGIFVPGATECRITKNKCKYVHI